MSSRTTFLASLAAAACFAACSSPYADVYSYRKNSFQAPVVPKTEIAAPTPIVDPFAGQPTTTSTPAIPGMPTGPVVDPGIPGVPSSDPAAAPGTPVPAPAPAPGAAPIPGL